MTIESTKVSLGQHILCSETQSRARGGTASRLGGGSEDDRSKVGGRSEQGRRTIGARPEDDRSKVGGRSEQRRRVLGASSEGGSGLTLAPGVPLQRRDFPDLRR